MKKIMLITAPVAFLLSAGLWLILLREPPADARRKDAAAAEQPQQQVAAKPTGPAPAKTVEVRMNREAIGLLTGVDASKALTAARVIPVAEGDRVKGFKMIAIDKKGLFGKTGFKNNDVILRVNDEAMDAAEKGMAIFNVFDGTLESFYMDVQRGKSLVRMKFTYKD